MGNGQPPKPAEGVNMEWFEYDAIAEDIIKALEEGKSVYIESGSAVDKIINYEQFVSKSLHREEAHINFTTTACIFPEVITLDLYDNIDTEENNKSMFVKVW
jgi:hypothetical protein